VVVETDYNTSKQSLSNENLAAIIKFMRRKAESTNIAVNIYNNKGTEQLSASQSSMEYVKKSKDAHMRNLELTREAIVNH
jgi:hypothetical protein